MRPCKLFCVWALASAMSFPAVAQGQINFANRVSGTVEARVHFLDGTPVGAGYTAQLYGGPVGTPISSLTPLLPTTIFRFGAGVGYIVGRIITVPEDVVRDGELGTFVMRVFEGASWETSLCRGESNPVNVRPISATPPPTDLQGLQSFQVSCIPEPGTTALLLAALLAGSAGRFAR